MTKGTIEKKILKETKGLSVDKLNEVLDFVLFIKSKNYNESSEKDILKELNNIKKGSLVHLEEEFNNYKKLYPYEQ